jgi:hypothetical protein
MSFLRSAAARIPDAAKTFSTWLYWFPSKWELRGLKQETRQSRVRKLRRLHLSQIRDSGKMRAAKAKVSSGSTSDNF